MQGLVRACKEFAKDLHGLASIFWNLRGTAKQVLAMTFKSFLGFAIVLVHGAGSFGHLVAKKWDIAGGLESSISKEQRKAVNMIRSDMRELSNLVASKLEIEGLYSESFPPSEWAEGTGPEFKGELGMFVRRVDQPIPITFGDVVKTGNEQQFGILSGDDLMLRISKDLKKFCQSL